MVADHTPSVEIIDATGRACLIDDAAQIWAEATAARDGDDDIPGLEISRPIIQGVLDGSSRAFLLIARRADGTVGFAVIEPLAGISETAAEVRYIGVRPGLWGQRVGEKLLAEARQRLRAAGYARAELAVYADNRRATALYEHLGWHPCGAPTPHPGTGKPEQRYELSLE